MNKEDWKQFKHLIEDVEEELPFFYKGDEWWISRVPEEKSFLLTRSKDSYTQEFYTAEELFNQGLMDGKPFIERLPEIHWE